MICPLCDHTQISDFHTDKKRHYWQCDQCQLVFVDPASLPSPQAEKREYDLHENHENDPGYIGFLSKIVPHVVDAFASRQGSSPPRLLDFGCGPTPALVGLMKEKGFETHYFDPFYFPNQEVFNAQYDVIVSTEAIEHFHSPKQEWETWQSLLKTGGVLAVMTKRVIDSTRFASWHYKNDPTHVSFFSEYTFKWLASRDKMNIHFPSSDIVIMRKQT